MGYTNSGLYNAGHTHYFSFLYDDSLSSSRGKELANQVMKYCDDDFSLLASWFPGVFLHIPFTVKIANISSENAAGGSWSGWGPQPLDITLKLGEFPVTMGTPTIAARYLLFVETSEVFMRERQLHRFNDWFEAFNEGSKGEALSLFLGIQFLFTNFGPYARVPGIGTGNFNVANLWLNSAARDDFIDTNPDVIAHNEITGCATLFLFYLHDQLGFGIPDIINAGARTLSDVYSNLTGDNSANAWNSFLSLVNLHCPQDHTTMYFPACDSIFPVANLDKFVVPREVSWVTNGNSQNAALVLDRITPVNVRVSLASDNTKFITIGSSAVGSGAVIPSNSASTTVGLQASPQPRPFRSKTVTLSAGYAGKILTESIKVVSPENLKLPALEIVPKISDNPCEQYFVEGSSQDFGIKNLDVIYDHTRLVYKWSVIGAIITNVTNAAVLSIPTLPAAGTKVTIHVVVTNVHRIHAQGTYEFTTTKTQIGLSELQREVDCYIRHIKSIKLYIPPWVQVEKQKTKVTKKQLTKIAKESRQVILEAAKVTKSINELKSSS